jgi:membrane protease YdiL (CAAX protease family)
MTTNSGNYSPPVNNDSEFFKWPNKLPFSWKQIFFGLIIPFLFLFCSYSLQIFTFLQCRPWTANQLSILLQILFFMSLFLYSILVCKRQGYWPLFHFGGSSSILANFIDSILILLLLLFTVFLPYRILEKIFKLYTDKIYFLYIFSYHFNSIFVFIPLILGFTIAPFFEELFFRGFLYNAFKTKTSIFIAVIFQAAVFSSIHVFRYHDFQKLLLIYLVGIALAIIYEKKKNLLIPSFVHCIINGCVLIPLLILSLQNYHIPAATMEEARIDPNWISYRPPAYVIKQKNGMAQWQYAIEKWGSKGSGQWKKEANAFRAVMFWFPNDQQSCAKANLGIITIYSYYLHDYRRAICEAEQLLIKYYNQEDE